MLSSSTRVAISTSGMVFQISWREGLLESRDVLRFEKWSAHRGRTQDGSEFGDPLMRREVPPDFLEDVLKRFGW